MITEEFDFSPFGATFAASATDLRKKSRTQDAPLASLLLSNAGKDIQTFGICAALARLMRSTQILRSPALTRRLLGNQVYRDHAQYLSLRDPFAFVAHRHYLARGLNFTQRLDAAVSHYGLEMRMPVDTYRKPVYEWDGLMLWKQECENEHYSIALRPGNDVLYEGGLSIVLSVGEGRVHVLSYSNVPRRVLCAGRQAPEELSAFIVRRHSAADHGYQKAFNHAFDRTTPGHLCVAALEGIALAMKMNVLYGISAHAHPSWRDSRHAGFRTAYNEFWESLSGTAGPVAYELKLPVQLPPVEEMNAKARKRALARRQHTETVRSSAFQAMRAAMGTALDAELPARAVASRLRVERPDPVSR